MLKPEFPYKGNQIVLSSQRVILHSNTDAIFLFGKAAVALSSTKTINLDANEEIYASSPKIYLGDITKATNSYQPTVLGNNMSQEFYELYKFLKALSDQLSVINETNFAAFATSVRNPARLLSDFLNRQSIELVKGSLLSKNVYVK
jgi:hypothetical protein